MASPFSAQSMFCAVMRDISVRVSISALPMCGKTTQLLSVNSGLSSGSGSGVVTSRPAARMQLFFRASYRSDWLTMPPRAVFTRIALGFILAKVSELIRLAVSGVKAHVIMMKSALAMSSSNGTRVAPNSFASAALSERFENSIFVGLNGAIRRATSWPIRPNPTTPTVEFFRPCPHIQLGAQAFQPPLATSLLDSIKRRDVANSKATVSSAVASVSTSGVYPTRMQRFLHSAKSMCS